MSKLAGRCQRRPGRRSVTLTCSCSFLVLSTLLLHWRQLFLWILYFRLLVLLVGRRLVRIERVAFLRPLVLLWLITLLIRLEGLLLVNDAALRLVGLIGLLVRLLGARNTCEPWLRGRGSNRAKQHEEKAQNNHTDQYGEEGMAP